MAEIDTMERIETKAEELYVERGQGRKQIPWAELHPALQEMWREHAVLAMEVKPNAR